MSPESLDLIHQVTVQSLNALATMLDELDDATLRDVWAAAINFTTDAFEEERRRGIDFDAMEAT